MKVFLLLAGVVALAAGSTVPPKQEVEKKPVDDEFIAKQKKIFSLLQHVHQLDYESEYYKTGISYDIKANIDKYTNKTAVLEFLRLYEHHGFLPKGLVFTSFYENMRDQSIDLFYLFYYAKDFETFYKTASWARVHLNEGMFVYSFSIAIIHREDTTGLILAAPYEVTPYFFVNNEVIQKMHEAKMKEGKVDPKVALTYGVVQDEKTYTIYANYTDIESWYNKEVRLSYFTEDIGLSTYYYYFHAMFPFWMKGDQYGWLKQRRGEIYYYIHQQLLARYYLERLVNRLGEIPQLSWEVPVKTGYYPSMAYIGGKTFTQRNNYHDLELNDYQDYLQIIKTHESQFLQYLQEGECNAHNGFHVNLRNQEAINFVGNYWQSNPDAYNETSILYYEVISRILLGGSPKPLDPKYVGLAALEKFATSVRDPVFWQLYKHIISYFFQYKQYLQPYSQEQLSFSGVKLVEVRVEKLVTSYEYFDFEGTNAVFYRPEDLNNVPYRFRIRQPRLTHKPFNVLLGVKSDVSVDAVIKIFLAPKYDSNGNEITFEQNWMNFYELDWFVQKLVVGKNVITRNSNEFFRFKEDSLSVSEILKLMENKEVPKDMSESYDEMPRRLMLPRGTKGGYPFQLFAIVYPYVPLPTEYSIAKEFYLDNKPLGYPFDRPVTEMFYLQPNMYVKDVNIYHEGAEKPNYYNIPGLTIHGSDVPML